MNIDIVDYDEAADGLEFRQRIMQQTFGLDPSKDIDQWDTVAKHFIVRHTGRVVGYYRAIEDTDIGFYTESEFDITNLNINRSSILEIGRAAADPDFRHASVLPKLWGELIDYAMQKNYRWIIGAASLKPAEVAVNTVASQWRDKYQYLNSKHAVPKIPYEKDDISTNCQPSKLIQVYEKIGATIASDPAWDPVFQTADVITLLDLESVNQRWIERLL